MPNMHDWHCCNNVRGGGGGGAGGSRMLAGRQRRHPASDGNLTPGSPSEGERTLGKPEKQKDSLISRQS